MVNLTILINGVDMKSKITDTLPTLTHTENHGQHLEFSMLKSVLNTINLNDTIIFKKDNVVIFLGNIFSITPRDETVEIVAGDGMNLLKGLGANYFYTHYRTRVIDSRVDDAVINNRLYLKIPNGILIESTPPPLYAVNIDPYDVTSNVGTKFESRVMFGKVDLIDRLENRIHQRFKIENRFLFAISVKFLSVSPNSGVRFAVCEDSDGVIGAEIPDTVKVVNTLTMIDSYVKFEFPVQELDTDKSYWFKLEDIENAPSASNFTNVELFKTKGLATNTNRLDAVATKIFISPVVPIYYLPDPLKSDDWSAPFKVHTADYKVITEGQSIGDKYYINKIQDVPDPFPTTIRLPVFRRGVVSYYADSVLTSAVLTKALDSQGLVLKTPMEPGKGLLKYKCRGSYLSTYVEDLTAMRGDGDYQTVMSSSMDTPNAFYLRRRKNISDTPDMTLEWGVDNIISFNPTKTMTNRPGVQFIRSEVINPAMGEPTVIMVSGVDLNSSILTSESLIDSAYGLSSDAFVQAYAILDSTSRAKWEGTIELPDIVKTFDMYQESNTFGSGYIIKIIHSGYGINENFKVKRAVWDFNEWKTTLTLSNVPEFTNPRISNMDKDRIQGQSTALSLGDTEGYVCIIDSTLKASGIIGSDMSIYNGTTILATVPSQKILSTRYNTATYHAYFPPGTGTIIAEHGVTRLKIGNKIIVLRESQYQDKYAEQGLTVDIIVRAI